MLNLIYVSYLLQWFIFINLIPASFTFHTRLEFAFANQYNLIRCSDNEVQVYFAKPPRRKFLNSELQCQNKNELYNEYYAPFAWNSIRLSCSSNNNHVREEIKIEPVHRKEYSAPKLPQFQAQIGHLNKLYELHVTQSDDNIIILESDDQLYDGTFFNSQQERKIYIWFPDHPVRCRIKYTVDKQESCADNSPLINSADYICYYTPGDTTEPSIELMEAEMKQVPENPKSDAEVYLLNLDRPNVKNSGNQDSSSNSNNQNQDSNSVPQRDQQASAAEKTKNAKKKSIALIIGIIIVCVVVLLAIVGGVTFFIVQKKKSNQSTSNPGQNEQSIENGEKPNTQIQKPNTQIQKPNSQIQKPNIQTQKANTNKRQRPNATMNFDDDE